MERNRGNVKWGKNVYKKKKGKRKKGTGKKGKQEREKENGAGSEKVLAGTNIVKQGPVSPVRHCVLQYSDLMQRIGVLLGIARNGSELLRSTH